MLAYEQALKTILKNTKEIGRSEKVPLSQALGRVLSHEVRAGEDVPHFSRSAMDGYALKSSATRGASKKRPIVLEVTGKIFAGQDSAPHIKSDHEAVRVMTGSRIPLGADSVIMQEFTKEFSKGGKTSVRLFDEVAKGKNISVKGEDIKRGECLLRANTFLRAQEIGVLASLGKTSVSVKPRPRVAIIPTGREIVPFHKKLKPSQIRDVNSITLSLLAKDYGAEAIVLGKAADSMKSLKAKLTQAKAKGARVILLSGGISEGEKDLVRETLKRMGVKEWVYKVATKPGKPLFFGTWGRILVFGLPGYPVSTFITFLKYVRFSLLKMLSLDWKPLTICATAGCDIRADKERLKWVRVKLTRRKNELYFDIKRTQVSSVLTSLVYSDAILSVVRKKNIKKGTRCNLEVMGCLISS